MNKEEIKQNQESILAEIEKCKKERVANEALAESYSAEGFDKMADHFYVLADKCNSRLAELDHELNELIAQENAAEAVSHIGDRAQINGEGENSNPFRIDREKFAEHLQKGEFQECATMVADIVVDLVGRCSGCQSAECGLGACVRTAIGHILRNKYLYCRRL